MVSRLIVAFGILATLVGNARAEPAMWVIRQNNATIYLVGTVHLLRQEAKWDRTKIEKALAESSELWLEATDMDDPALALSLVQKYGFDSEQPLSSKLSAAQKEKMAKAAAEFGFTANSFDQLQPWVVALTLSVLPLQKAGSIQKPVLICF